MFKVNNNTKKITITQGDNASLRVNLKERELFDDDELVLTISKYAGSPSVIQKTAKNGVFDFIPEDTKSLATGYYTYDIQLTTFGGKIYTIVPSATFEISMEVSK